MRKEVTQMACQCGCTTTVEPDETFRARIPIEGADGSACGCSEESNRCNCGERAEGERRVSEVRQSA